MSEEEKGMPEAQPPVEEAKPEQPDKPEQPAALCGISAQLEQNGRISHRVWGEMQNVTILYGLVEILQKEVTAIASSMPGSTPTRDVRLLSNIAGSISNMANVLIAMQSGMKQILDRLEGMTDAKPESEQPDSP